MAISRVQANSGYNAANNTTVSFASPPTAGNKMIARCRGQDCTTDISIPGWTLDQYARVGAAATYVAILSKTAGASESSNVTVTMVSASNVFLEIEEWQEVNTLDKVAKTDNTGGVTSRSTGTTATTTADAELCIAVCGFGDAGTSPSWSNSFSADFALAVGSIKFIGASKVISAAAAIETTASWTTTRVAGACVATYKLVSAGGPPKVKTVNGIAMASVKTVNGVAIASVKSINGIT